MNVLCITYHEIIHTIPDGWNRSFTCTYSNSTLNFNLCISDLKVTDAGLFSLKISNIFVQNVTLQIQVNVYNVTLIPSDNPLTIREGTQRGVWCVVNSNADPAPNITWYLGSTDITSTAVINTTFITLIGNRIDNTKTLQCRATNTNNPPKIKITTINVEYPPMVDKLSKHDIIEGRNLSITCMATSGNPNPIIYSTGPS